jgi:acetoacetyl-CoA synthetase
VRPGDRVVAYMPNIPETLVAFAATASLGAIWASCAPELGARSVVDRLAQLDPTVRLAVGGYGFREGWIDRRGEVREIRARLPTLRYVVGLEYGEHAPDDAVSWEDLLAEPARLEFEPVAFDHPLYVLFSSGTTGPPKAIVHGHGGILLEHLKSHALSWDLGPGDRLQWFTTTSWMMWNSLVSALLRRASAVTIDGDPTWPTLDWQWQSLSRELSPRHVPDAVVAVPAVPRTLAGKKLEAPVKRILAGAPPEKVASLDALLDRTAFDAFVAFAAGRRGES